MLPELIQDWEIDSWREQENLVHQGPEERRSDPTGDCPRLACVCPRVSGGGVGQWWPAAGLGTLSVAEHAWDLLREVTVIFITSTIVWPQVNSREGTQLHSSTENWINDLLSMAPPNRTRPRFPLSSRFHQEASISLLSSPSEGRQTENHYHRKLTSLITWTTALSNSVKL